jgi:hypothetical protein
VKTDAVASLPVAIELVVLLVIRLQYVIGDIDDDRKRGSTNPPPDTSRRERTRNTRNPRLIPELILFLASDLWPCKAPGM